MRHHMEVFFCSLCLAFAPAMAQAASAAIASVRNAAALSGNGGNGSGQEQQYENPLDKPFHPKHTYPGTNIPTNVVPISTKMHGEHVCGAFRINKNWLLTAAHCLDFFGTKNTRVSFQINKGDNGVMEVQFYPVKEDYPANADIYFYREGYSCDSKFGHAEDIALVRLQEKESASVARRNQQAIQALDGILGFESFVGEKNVQGAKQAKSKLIALPKDRKAFFAQPLNPYSFFVTPPEGIFHFKHKRGTVFEFRAYETYAQTQHRDAPRAHIFSFFKKSGGDGSHELLWRFNKKLPNGENIATSGSPVIINGFVVSNTSGPKVKGVRATPLYAPQFHQFLQQTMGKEYPKGLCLTPNFPGPLPKWEPKK